MTKAIHQFVHTLSYGDAISGEVLSLQSCLRDMGLESEVYAINVHPRLKGKARDYRDFLDDFSGEIVLHYSLGSPLNGRYLAQEKASKTLIYHNLTPPHWFEGINPRIVSDIEEGVKELPQLLASSQRVLADSSFNAGEIKQLGFDAEVLQLPVDPDRWNTKANAGISALLKSDPGIHLLHVGRLAPNKCIEDIIRVFYFLHHHINSNSKLWLVGIDIDTELYSFALKRLAFELRVDHAVNFAGCMADSELRALYEGSTAYLCMSEHEGFCLPVIEAMHFGLPVVAYSSSAVPDTVGEGGILLKDKKHPEIAELINVIYEKEDFRGQLCQAGRSRVKELSFELFAEHVGKVFNSQP